MSTAETKDDLRDGLAICMFREVMMKCGSSDPNSYYVMADAALVYLRAHDTHAEFVRAVREISTDKAHQYRRRLLDIVALCDAEMAKGDI